MPGGEASTAACFEATQQDTITGDRPFNLVLATRPLMPLEEFFAVTAEGPRPRNPLANSLWPKQAYGFGHLCQFGANGKFKQPFEQRVGRRNASEVARMDLRFATDDDTRDRWVRFLASLAVSPSDRCRTSMMLVPAFFVS